MHRRISLADSLKKVQKLTTSTFTATFGMAIDLFAFRIVNTQDDLPAPVILGELRLKGLSLAVDAAGTNFDINLGFDCLSLLDLRDHSPDVKIADVVPTRTPLLEGINNVDLRVSGKNGDIDISGNLGGVTVNLLADFVVALAEILLQPFSDFLRAQASGTKKNRTLAHSK
jgi:hypothetical protein